MDDPYHLPSLLQKLFIKAMASAVIQRQESSMQTSKKGFHNKIQWFSVSEADADFTNIKASCVAINSPKLIC